MAAQPERCSSCILSSAFPGIEFDGQGVCNFCRDRIYHTTEDESVAAARGKVRQLFDEHRGKGRYDAVMCYSGGKDSTYTLMQAIRKHRLKVLAFTMNNGFLSSGAMDNIHRVVDTLGVDLVVYRPASRFFDGLVRASALGDIYPPRTLTRISAVCNSCISLINISALRIALERRIPIILAGFTLGQIPANSIVYRHNYRFLEESREPILKRLSAALGDEVDDYFRIDPALLDSVAGFPYNVNLLCLSNPPEQEMIAEIEKIGWAAPEDVDGCSSNCRLNAFNNYVHIHRTGYNPYELELSHMVRKGLMTREEALAKVLNQFRPDGKDLRQIMSRLGITQQEIEESSARNQ